MTMTRPTRPPGRSRHARYYSVSVGYSHAAFDFGTPARGAREADLVHLGDRLGCLFPEVPLPVAWRVTGSDPDHGGPDPYAAALMAWAWISARVQSDVELALDEEWASSPEAIVLAVEIEAERAMRARQVTS